MSSAFSHKEHKEHKAGWKTVRLGEIGRIVTGKTPSTKIDEYWSGDKHFVTPGDLQRGKYINHTERYVSNCGLLAVKSAIIPRNSICVSCIGTIGYVSKATQECITNQQINSIIPFADIDGDFVYYKLKELWPWFKHYEGQSTTVSILNKSFFSEITISLPPLATQKKIAAVLGALDDKIELNRKMNANLEAQAQALFKSWFVDFTPFGGKMPKDWKKGTASDYFDISIGKTPPRKIQTLFSDDKLNNVVWVSIADMGKSEAFIGESAEYLIPSAVSDYNIIEVPKDTVILSFKLTVGRVAIASCNLTTNEAIAHFKTDDSDRREYTYLYLKNFHYDTLGSTSSIATAVNSKTIRSMPFLLPSANDLKRFSNIVRPFFNKMCELQVESRKLAELRDTLLPKLMKGEIIV